MTTGLSVRTGVRFMTSSAQEIRRSIDRVCIDHWDDLSQISTTFWTGSDEAQRRSGDDHDIDRYVPVSYHRRVLASRDVFVLNSDYIVPGFVRFLKQTRPGWICRVPSYTSCVLFPLCLWITMIWKKSTYDIETRTACG